ncbi:unnamed protein product [Moneuplotes crassus]|uniref:Thioredoxin domain-containing protein n=2 Tax=Euplotes crassus TaxID=5936 RepID=A0AAD1XYU0_EUPCR|nr:unnamed protein product [Moneuplotes crassus]
MEGSNYKETTNAEEFLEIFNEQKEKGEPWVAWFTSGHSEELGKLWCPDCVKTEESIKKGLEEHWADKFAVKAILATRDDWKGQTEHPYRTHESIQVDCIPTLIVYNGGEQKVKEKDENVLADEAKVQEILTSHV